MTTHNNLLWIPVPGDAVVEVIQNYERTIIQFEYGIVWEREIVPPDYTYLCTNDQMTEEVAAQLIIDRLAYDNGGTPDENGIDKIYESFGDDEFPYSSALGTWIALERSLGITGRQAVFVKK